MKSTVIVLLLAFLTFGSMAQGSQKENRESKKAEMKASLNLTEEQSKAWDDIHSSFKAQMETLKSKEGLSDDERRRAAKEVRAEQRTAILDLLTDEQEVILNEQKRNHRKEKQKRHKQKMSEELQLTPEQEKQMKDVNQRYQEQIKAVKADESLTDEQKKSTIKNLKSEKKEVVKSLLTEEQQAKMEELKKNKKKNEN